MKTPKKLTALVLMGALTVSSIAAVPASAKTFNDVPSNHWAYAVIDEVSNKGVMVGTGTAVFSPNTQLTRAEYAAILANLATDKSNGRYEVTYTDVDENAWYADAAEWVVSRGIYTVKDGKFEPNKPISRELMADMTYKFIYYMYTSQIVPNTTSAGYADESSFSSEYAGSINALTHNGLLSGRGDNKFEPQGTLTRAEAAAMASRLLPIVEEDAEPEDPNEPSEPEEPSEPSEPEDPGETEDPNDPSNWDLDGAPEWFLVGRPDGITVEQWNELITYWADKEKPGDYPSSIPSSITTEERAKSYFEYYIKDLYDKMQKEYAKNQLESGKVSLNSEEMKMIELVNAARRAAGVPELKVAADLCTAASIRAEEVPYAEAHRRPNGDDCPSILKETEVNLYYPSLSFTSGTNLLTYIENQTLWRNHSSYSADYAFEQFYNSPGHKRAMLDPTYEYIGIGYYSDGNNAAWVQSFIKM